MFLSFHVIKSTTRLVWKCGMIKKKKKREERNKNM